jgi:hypothetical protein
METIKEVFDNYCKVVMAELLKTVHAAKVIQVPFAISDVYDLPAPICTCATYKKRRLDNLLVAIFVVLGSKYTTPTPVHGIKENPNRLP